MNKLFRNITMLIVALASGDAYGQVVFSQDFSAGGTTATYTGSGANQFDGITTANSSNLAWSITSNTLQGVRSNSTTSAGEFSRTTDLPTISGAIYEFSINVISSTSNATSALVFRVGSGFTTSNADEVNANTHSRFGVNLTSTGGYQFRDIGAGTNSSTFSGSNNVFFVVNNTGTLFSYTAPNGSSATTANDTWDLWVGTTSVFNDIAATTATVSPTDFKMLWAAAGGLATIQFDNFRVTAIPEPSTWMACTIAICLLGYTPLRRFLRVSRRR
jgi:hypothetical protein